MFQDFIIFLLHSSHPEETLQDEPGEASVLASDVLCANVNWSVINTPLSFGEIEFITPRRLRLAEKSKVALSFY